LGTVTIYDLLFLWLLPRFSDASPLSHYRTPSWILGSGTHHLPLGSWNSSSSSVHRLPHDSRRSVLKPNFFPAIPSTDSPFSHLLFFPYNPIYRFLVFLLKPNFLGTYLRPWWMSKNSPLPLSSRIPTISCILILGND
jgi:hypothetical protein